MALLSDADRQQIWKNVMSEWSSRRETLGLVVKADIRAAISAVDAWTDGNLVSLNAAIPLQARTGLTARQKTELLFFVLRRRFEVA